MNGGVELVEVHDSGLGMLAGESSVGEAWSRCGDGSGAAHTAGDITAEVLVTDGLSEEDSAKASASVARSSAETGSEGFCSGCSCCSGTFCFDVSPPVESSCGATSGVTLSRT